MRASSEDDFYKAGWWNGIDDPEAGLKGHAVAIDYRANGLDMTVFCTSITNKAHQTDDYRLATNAIYSKLLGTDFTVESGETPEPTPNPGYQARYRQGYPVSGDRRRHDRYRVGHGRNSVCGRCDGALRQEACGSIFFRHIT